MTVRWGENTTFKFVMQYKAHDCLWDYNSPLYKNKIARDAACQNIADIMGIKGFGVPEVKIKIKNLRSTYFQELKKIKRSIQVNGMENMGNVYKPGLKWFKEMDTILKARRIAEYEIEGVSDSDMDLIKFECSNQTLFAENNEKYYPDMHVSSPSFVNTTVVEDDEFECFGKYISTQLKRLSTERAIKAKEHIHTYLTQQRLEELHDVPQNDEPVLTHVTQSEDIEDLYVDTPNLLHISQSHLSHSEKLDNNLNASSPPSAPDQEMNQEIKCESIYVSSDTSDST